VEDEVLKDHLDHCVTSALASGDEREAREKAAELIAVLGRALK
jgi:DNA-binding FrmR family transcriptional regulator